MAWDGFNGTIGLVDGPINGQAGWIAPVADQVSPVYVSADGGIEMPTLGDGDAENFGAFADINRSLPFMIQTRWWLADHYVDGFTPPDWENRAGGDDFDANYLFYHWRYYTYTDRPNKAQFDSSWLSNGHSSAVFPPVSNITLSPATPHTLRIVLMGTSASYYVDDTFLASGTIPSPTTWDSTKLQICLYGKSNNSQDRLVGVATGQINSASINSILGMMALGRSGLGVSMPVASLITVSPDATSVRPSQSKQFSSVAFDQAGATMFPQPDVVWSLTSGSGSINGNGLFTAPSNAGLNTVRATNGSLHGDAIAQVFFQQNQSVNQTAFPTVFSTVG